MISTYDGLCRMAANKLRRDRLGYTLERSDVAQEASLRIIDSDVPLCKDPARFSRTASRVLQHVLVDEARKRLAQKRGAGAEMLPLETIPLRVRGNNTEEFFALGEVLHRLKRIDPQISRVVELRFFEGLTVKESAVALSVSETTVKTRWNLARVWLRGHLEKRGERNHLR